MKNLVVAYATFFSKLEFVAWMTTLIISTVSRYLGFQALSDGMSSFSSLCLIFGVLWYAASVSLSYVED